MAGWMVLMDRRLKGQHVTHLTKAPSCTASLCCFVFVCLWECGKKKKSVSLRKKQLPSFIYGRFVSHVWNRALEPYSCRMGENIYFPSLKTCCMLKQTWCKSVTNLLRYFHLFYFFILQWLQANADKKAVSRLAVSVSMAGRRKGIK